MKRKETGLALVNTLIFTIIFVILAGILLALLSSHTRFIENDIRRVKAQYVAEAGSVAALDSLRRGVAPASVNVEWTHDAAGNPLVYKTAAVTNQSGAGIGGTTVVNALGNYTFNW